MFFGAEGEQRRRLMRHRYSLLLTPPPFIPTSVLFSSAIQLQMVSLTVYLSHPSWTFIFVSFLFSYVGAERIFIANRSWDVSIAMATVDDLTLSFQASQILWNVTEVLSEELKKLSTWQTERMGLTSSSSSGQEAYRQTGTEAAFRPSICLAVSPHVKQLLQFFVSQTLCAKCLSDVWFWCIIDFQWWANWGSGNPVLLICNRKVAFLFFLVFF